jgi:hypothetical protein
MKKIFALISALFFLTTFSAKAEVQFGFGLMAGQLSSDGTETEGTAADTSNRSKSFEETFFGADLFLEVVNDSGLTFGISYVPVDFELGSGTRVDTSTGADVASEADTGTRTASADVTDLMSVYTNIPMGGNGFYGLLGGKFATITTSETLNTSNYGNEDVMAYEIGLGKRNGKVKYELSYTDFEDISLSSSGGGTNSITADADALTFRLSVGF